MWRGVKSIFSFGKSDDRSERMTLTVFHQLRKSEFGGDGSFNGLTSEVGNEESNREEIVMQKLLENHQKSEGCTDGQSDQPTDQVK